MVRRDEIDGLRALAIIPVILSHVGFKNFTGGFIGVDVFFVISGYLISSIIASQIQENNFSIYKFYIRRLQRLFPLLFFVTVLSILLFIFILTPLELRQFFKSIVGLSLFSSNFIFYLESGYFDIRSIQKPLLHTWSLAVEEQFYIFFPFIFIPFLRLKFAIRIILILVLISSGIFLSQYFSILNPSGSFYLIFSRWWELLIGVLCSFLYPRIQDLVNDKIFNFFSLIGIFLLIGSIFIFNESSIIHPGYYTTIPVFSTVLIILFTKKQSLSHDVLSSKLLVFIGTISYSLYLFHQPVFVLFRHFNLIDFYSQLVSIFLLFVVSYFAKIYIEDRFRFVKFKFRNYFFSWITLIFIGVIGYFYKWDGLYLFFLNNNQKVSYQTATFSPFRNTCHSISDTSLSCVYFGNNLTTAVFGDSHGIEFAESLAGKLAKNNQSLVQLTYSCPPAYKFSTGDFTQDKWFKDSFLYLKKKSIKNVFLVWRHSAYLFGNNEDYFPEFVSNSTTLMIKDGNTPSKKREIYMISFVKLINDLIKLGKNVYVVLPIPEQGIHINKFFKYVNHSNHNVSGISLEYYKNRNRYFFEHFINVSSKAHLIDPLKSIPFTISGSIVIRNDSSLYFDDNHLSVYGSSLLVNNLSL